MSVYLNTNKLKEHFRKALHLQSTILNQLINLYNTSVRKLEFISGGFFPLWRASDSALPSQPNYLGLAITREVY